MLIVKQYPINFVRLVLFIVSIALFVSPSLAQDDPLTIIAEARILTAQRQNLTTLDLSRLNLREIPSEVFSLTELRELDLSSNRISSLPPELFLLTELRELNLSSMGIISLPPEIGQLTNLEVLDLNSNTLSMGLMSDISPSPKP